MSSGNTQAHSIDNRDRGTTDIEHSQTDLETNQIMVLFPHFTN